MNVAELVGQEVDVLVLENLDVAQVGGFLDRHRAGLDVADLPGGRLRPALSCPGHSGTP
jgi:hypothetical protein